MKSILLLGASGYIGSSILQSADSDKEIERILAVKHIRPFKTYNSTKIKVINSQIDKLDLNSLKPECIIHAARQSSPRGRIGRFIKSFEGKGINNKLLSNFQNIELPNSKLWYVSGSLMYGSLNSGFLTESSPLNPISFAKEYIHAERPFINAHKSPNVHLIRVPWVFGNGSWFKRFYIDFMKEYNAIPLFGDGKNVMTFIDKEDLANSILLTCKMIAHPIVNLFMNNYCIQEEFVSEIQSVTGLPILRISKEQVVKNYGMAVFEAFNSNIKLGSDHDLDVIHSKMKFNSISKMIQTRIPEYLNTL